MKNMEKYNIDSSYKEFLENQNEKIDYILSKISESENYTPDNDFIFKALSLPLSEVKVVILGQDPYPQKGAATGLSFEVGGLNSFYESFRQSSLKNILKLIYKSYYGEIITFNSLKENIRNNVFKIKAPNLLFKSWFSQGVMLLNTSLSTEIGKPGSHSKLWAEFTEELIAFIDNYNVNINWFLWGAHAKKYKKFINKGKIYESNHPAICNVKNEKDFLNNKCFEKTKEIINWLG